MPEPAARPCTSTPGRIVAHRGASRVAPENTLAAFRLAAAQGARWIEFDVSLIGDGTPVILHDATLERCTDHRGPLARLAAADLAAIDAGGWFGPDFTAEPLPTLAATLDLIAGLGLSANLEMKPHGDPPEAMAEAVEAALAARPWSGARILVSSFDLAALEALRRRMPQQPIAVLYEAPPTDWPARLAALQAGSLHIRHRHLTADLLATAAAEGIAVRVYTVNDPALMAPFRDAGLTGVITDHPPLFLDDPAWAAWAAGAGPA